MPSNPAWLGGVINVTSKQARCGGVDPKFTSQYFQYGRYLLIADSRPGTMAFNNHNLWLDNLKGRRRGRWTRNIKIQECYWPAEGTGLQSTVESLHEFIADLAASGPRTARAHYGALGWSAHHGTDAWMNTAMAWSIAGWWWAYRSPTGGEGETRAATVPVGQLFRTRFVLLFTLSKVFMDPVWYFFVF